MKAKINRSVTTLRAVCVTSLLWAVSVAGAIEVAGVNLADLSHYAAEGLHAEASGGSRANGLVIVAYANAKDAERTCREVAAFVRKGAAVRAVFAAGAQPVLTPYHERLGAVIACCANADLELTPDGVVVHGDDGPELRPVPLPPVRRHGVADAFARAVLEGEAPLFDGAWGLETLAVLHALLRSAAEGRDVSPAELIEAERKTP